MSSQRRQEFVHNNGSQAALPSLFKQPHKVPPPRAQPDADRVRSKTAGGYLEGSDERFNARRDVEGRHRSSSRSSRADVAVAGYYSATPVISTSRNVVSTARPSSRDAATGPPNPINPTVQASFQSQARSQPQRWTPDTPESYDLRTHLQKRAPVAPTPKSSYEQVSGAEDGSKTTRHLRTRRGAGTPTQVMRNTSAYDLPSSSRTNTEKEKDRERERRREKDSERLGKSVEEEWMAAESRRRERDKIRENERKERERYTEGESERRQQSEHKSVSRSTPPSRGLKDNRAEDPDSSDSARRRPLVPRHRRHRTEEGTQSTSAVS